jgi:hypothetical protein
MKPILILALAALHCNSVISIASAESGSQTEQYSKPESRGILGTIAKAVAVAIKPALSAIIESESACAVASGKCPAEVAKEIVERMGPVTRNDGLFVWMHDSLKSRSKASDPGMPIVRSVDIDLVEFGKTEVRQRRNHYMRWERDPDDWAHWSINPDLADVQKGREAKEQPTAALPVLFSLTISAPAEKAEERHDLRLRVRMWIDRDASLSSPSESVEAMFLWKNERWQRMDVK